jgi:alanine racemase
VLSEIGQVRRWAERSAGAPSFLQLDSGMTRLGLGGGDVQALAGDRRTLDALGLGLVMSHLAAADEPSSPMSRAQLREFEALTARLPAMPRSLANSSAIFLGPEFHMDLVRPGAALYGINPLPGHANPMHEVVRLQAPIVQLRETVASVRVGYGATREVGPGRRIATVAVGYADGYPRASGNRGHVAIDGRIAPLLGRVSMDLITVDVTDLPQASIVPGAMVDLIGGGVDLDRMAAEADTIGYEILTRLSRRASRRYLPAEPGDG